MVTIDKHTGVLTSPVEALEGYLQSAGTTVLQAAFEHSFFVDPARVRAKTPWFPKRARMSREHYPGVRRGQQAFWEGRPVTICDNGYAQQAWQRYTRRKLERGSGYSVRHIWGNPWDPDAFTAGWNLCYMPFWAGMLTKRQQPHPLLEQAVRQASWDLYFRDNPVCAPPRFVKDAGMNLDTLLGGQPLRILEGTMATTTRKSVPPLPPGSLDRETLDRIQDIKKQRHQSWSNICKAVRALQAKAHEPFGTKNVAASSKSTVRRILRETNLNLAQLEALLDEHGRCS